MTRARRAPGGMSVVGRTAGPNPPDPPVEPARVTVRARLGAGRLEGLQLEIRRLALRLGLAVADVRIRRIDGPVRSGGRPRVVIPSARQTRPRRG